MWLMGAIRYLRKLEGSQSTELKSAVSFLLALVTRSADNYRRGHHHKMAIQLSQFCDRRDLNMYDTVGIFASVFSTQLFRIFADNKSR